MEGVLLVKAGQRSLVAGRVEKDATGRQPVAPGATCFLVIILQGPGRAIVDDKAHIGLVHTHTKGDRGYHDAGLVAHEAVLGRGPVLDTGVVVYGRYSTAAKHCGELFAFES